jgi:hypothetical protein
MLSPPLLLQKGFRIFFVEGEQAICHCRDGLSNFPFSSFDKTTSLVPLR